MRVFIRAILVVLKQLSNVDLSKFLITLSDRILDDRLHVHVGPDDVFALQDQTGTPEVEEPDQFDVAGEDSLNERKGKYRSPKILNLLKVVPSVILLFVNALKQFFNRLRIAIEFLYFYFFTFSKWVEAIAHGEPIFFFISFILVQETDTVKHLESIEQLMCTEISLVVFSEDLVCVKHRPRGLIDIEAHLLSFEPFLVDLWQVHQTDEIHWE